MVAPPRKFYPKSPDSSMAESDLKKELSLVLKKQSATLPPGFVDIQLPKVRMYDVRRKSKVKIFILINLYIRTEAFTF